MDYLALHNIAEEKAVVKTENEVELEYYIGEECDFFNGHFPEIHLVPAVAQIDMASYFSQKYFGTTRFIQSAKRLKFTCPVKPNVWVRMSLKYSAEKNSVTYKLTSADGEKSYSGGSFVISR
ncbi:MAG: hydroxymyristoyl-ACP dehydratase [Treponema sp.]|uniref:ApeI family dehydratase n=1 Tax=Treponema sp. TaxID=166 RepID=UPI00298E7ABF|nr:hydroxymyristoyl-ACP dehydratase [Treponema sp.]MBR5933383.1 hydroxymyristoyl-ACP dehydratase [Treponema sp.]